MRPERFNQGTGSSETFIPLKYVYDFWEDFILLNDTIPPGTPSVVVSWRDTSGTVVLVPNPTTSIINANDRKNSYIRVEAGPDQGNAIINFSVGSTVYWSFHIWNTEYSPYEPAGQILYETPTLKNIFMDRNLGAMDTLYTLRGRAKGLYYQFGRKDPFPGSEGWTNTFSWYPGGTGTVPQTALDAISAQPTGALSNVVRPREAIPEILNYPTTFYRSPFTNHNGEDSSLWNTKGGNKTAFDPCPEGYRVPIGPIAIGSGDMGSPWYQASFSPGSGNFQNGYYSNALNYFPGAYIYFDGVLNSSSAAAYYWTSYTTTQSNIVAVGMFTPNVSTNIDKATGAYVRCVIDKNYILNKGTIFGKYTKDIIDDL
jgi:hypothetical protein